jgi:uncharacterized membrane protein YdjX (TVP38/TMEM64 family)
VSGAISREGSVIPSSEERPPASLLQSPVVQIVLVLVLVSILGSLVWSWMNALGGLEEVARRYGLIAALLLVPLQTLISLSFSPIPSDVVVFATSLVYGFWLGTLFGWIGWMAGALIQYAVVRRIARDIDVEALRRRLPAWLRRVPADHPLFLICGRWLPLGPHVVNTTAGVVGVPLLRFLWCAAVGIAPAAALIAALASGFAWL